MKNAIYCLIVAGQIGLMLAMFGCETPQINIPDVIAQDTAPEVTSTPMPDADEAIHNFTHVTPITDSLTLTGMYANKVMFTGSARNWTEGVEKGCHGEFHLFILRNGKWLGGKIDHIRNNTGDRDFNNIGKDYQIWATLKPVSGEAIAMILISYDKTKRTNAIFSNWK